MTILLPLTLVSELNVRGREHWSVRHRRAKAQRGAIALALDAPYRKAVARLPRPLQVTITRIIGKRGREYDSDNLTSCGKSVRDGIAAVLGIDDGSAEVRWSYAQERGASFGVRVTIEGSTNGCDAKAAPT